MKKIVRENLRVLLLATAANAIGIVFCIVRESDKSNDGAVSDEDDVLLTVDAVVDDVIVVKDGAIDDVDVMPAAAADNEANV